MTNDNTSPEILSPDESPASAEHTFVTQAAPGAEPAETLPEYTMTDLPASLRAGFERMGWTELMPVQARAIPYLLAGRDLMIQSRTGSGKTGAYVLPILERIDPEQAATQALVLVPTRELAQQVVREAETLGSGMVAHACRLWRRRLRPAARRLPPGRPPGGRHARPHPRPPAAPLADPGQLKILIFDEADRMLSMGFYPDMKRVQRYLPRTAHQHLHVLGHLPTARAAPGRRVPAQAGLAQPASDHVHVTETEHVYLRRAGDGQGPRPGAHHRDGEPGLGDHLLQHQRARQFRGHCSAALRLRRRRDQLGPVPEGARSR